MVRRAPGQRSRCQNEPAQGARPEPGQFSLAPTGAIARPHLAVVPALQGSPFNYTKTMVKEGGYGSLYAGIGAGVIRQVFYATSR